MVIKQERRQEARKGAHVELPSAQEVEHKERAESPKKAPVKTSTVETESTEGLENVVIKRPSTSTSESPTTTKKEASDEVMLKHSAAHDLPVLALRFTVMPSGILAFLSEAAPRDGQAAIHCYEDNAAGVSNLCTYAITCYHTHIRGGNVIFGILGISIGSLERLAVSCSGCRLITLLNLETGHSSTAFNLGMVSPTAMCLGEAGQMFVAGLRNIIQLSCSTEMFQLLQVIPKPQRAWTMTYVPEHRLIAFGCRSKEIHAISVDTKEALWKCNSGEANSLVYPAELGALLAGDSATNNIQVFNAADGTCIWKFRSPGLKVTRMGNLCVSKGQLMLHCTESDTEKVVSWQLGWSRSFPVDPGVTRLLFQTDWRLRVKLFHFVCQCSKDIKWQRLTKGLIVCWRHWHQMHAWHCSLLWILVTGQHIGFCSYPCHHLPMDAGSHYGAKKTLCETVTIVTETWRRNAALDIWWPPQGRNACRSPKATPSDIPDAQMHAWCTCYYTHWLVQGPNVQCITKRRWNFHVQCRHGNNALHLETRNTWHTKHVVQDLQRTLTFPWCDTVDKWQHNVWSTNLCSHNVRRTELTDAVPIDLWHAAGNDVGRTTAWCIWCNTHWLKQRPNAQCVQRGRQRWKLPHPASPWQQRTTSRETQHVALPTLWDKICSAHWLVVSSYCTQGQHNARRTHMCSHNAGRTSHTHA